MTLFSAQGAHSSLGRGALADVLALFGILADDTAGEISGSGARAAAVALAIAQFDEIDDHSAHALYWAMLLRNAGAFGNAALQKSNPLPERGAMMARWDIPAAGARVCERIGALPNGTADIVRWQAEAWDGTGFPDQLRWNAIPKPAQFAAPANAFVRFSGEPEEALAAIVAESGKTFSPDATRAFVMWFHRSGGEIDPVDAPPGSLETGRTAERDLIELIADRIDEHNGTPHRWRRISRRAAGIASALGFDERSTRMLALASALFGSGELHAAAAEEHHFDPLARLGIASRAKNASASAALVGRCALVAELAPVLAARSEWYDGTGKPGGLRGDDIPPGARVLAACIAY
ncbi:MAG: hypothetical protein M3R35_02130, partial [Candidatus Eremiobacteraeota bacterium]|nr:hypothetical protein [Candidatus Eremiobacteraeota bacterium]